MQLLRQCGLIELVRRGNRRRGQSDEYRLILAVDLLERLDVPSPEQEREEIAKVKEQNVAAGSGRQRKALALTQTSANELISAQTDPGLALTPDPPPSIGPLPEIHPPSSGENLRTDLTLVREQAHERKSPKFGIEEEDQNRSGQASAPRPRTTAGQRAITEAQARMAAKRAVHASAGSQP